jgi:HEAT repeat protein
VRYLRVGPAAELALADPKARALFEQALVGDPDSRVRALATNSVQDARAFQPALLRGLADADPRVRMAAAHALATAADAQAAPTLVSVLRRDSWPAVRGLAAEALGAAPVSEATDQQLVAALEDDAWVVRRSVLGALGARGARAHAEAVLERLDDDEEWPAVRQSAARALGALCYTPALSSLTTHVRTLADPMVPSEERGLGYAALGALRDLAPADLQKRLAPLLDKRAPAGARAAAEAALHDRSPRCRPRS